MINNKKIFAVEIHLTCNRFINSKNFLNNIFIPDSNDLLFHTIINYQLNDYGSIKAGFHLRTLFDVVNISNNQPDLIKQVPNSLHVKKNSSCTKKFKIIDYKTPLNLLFFETRFKLINKFYFFSFINDFLFNIFKFMAVSPLIRIKQIIALLFRKDYRIMY